MECEQSDDRASGRNESYQKAGADPDFLSLGYIQLNELRYRQRNHNDVEGNVQPAVSVSSCHSVDACPIASVGILPCIGQRTTCEDHSHGAGNRACAQDSCHDPA